MLYTKKDAPRLDPELFRKPTAEYRGAPFWAWNCKLEEDELLRQLDILYRMGFGGAHMHVRTGMATRYLSDEFLHLIRSCVDKAKAEHKLAYLYDEDRWPSGAAGGLVTKDPQYRARYLLFTPTPYAGGDKVLAEQTSAARAGRAENGRLLACFDVELDEEGRLLHYRTIGEQEPAAHEKWYAYLELHTESGWFNNQTYVNTLDKKAMDRFIDITYESYNRTVAGEFGKTVPSIFTDEPQFTLKSALHRATDKADVTLPWTDDLPESFAAAYAGEDVLAGIPELIWDRADGQPSRVRYRYHDHICERFTEAFADNCGAWCRRHGLALTGHMMQEPTLHSQTGSLGETMRAYRAFDLPGIDMLCGDMEYTTAKQAQSAVHQYGYEGMTSELYGVTNWDFDFRGHKLHGDWQAALGVTLRVPHLSWVSMAGEAKRDYPASISYQSPWWREYPRIEDHFARLNTALTRGKPVVRIGVIHPVESYWLHWGPTEQTQDARGRLEHEFLQLTEWLLFGSLDFDFISESLLPEQCAVGGAPLQVGKMDYDVVIVPGCETLRRSTLERLEAFRAAGGTLIFVGDAPALTDAVPDDRGAKLAAQSVCIPVEREAVLAAAAGVRLVELRLEDGSRPDDLLYQLRQDGDARWLFLSRGRTPADKDSVASRTVTIRLTGDWQPTVYDTQTGETRSIPYTAADGQTEIRWIAYSYDSLLLRLEPGAGQAAAPETAAAAGTPLALPAELPYTLSEPNVLLLERAEYALDGGEWQPAEEILRLDNACRQQLGWMQRFQSFPQPWVIPEETPTHSVSLRVTVHSDIDCAAVQLAIEDAEQVQLRWNGQPVPSAVTGWYVDKSIQTVALPGLHKGENTLEAVIPFGERTNIEWMYLLGEFGVAVEGAAARIVPLPKTLRFGDITKQGLPFYGGNVTYHIPLETHGGALTVTAPRYRGVLQTATLDGGAEQALIFPPYTAALGHPAAGSHTLDMTLYGHRRNSFGPIHLADQTTRWIGPDAWRTAGSEWNDNYMLTEEGILTPPTVTEA